MESWIGGVVEAVLCRERKLRSFADLFRAGANRVGAGSWFLPPIQGWLDRASQGQALPGARSGEKDRKQRDEKAQ
ncbi:MAG TPA: hypothetical protein PK958_03675 [Rhodocyclaceae bacterium]|nr:hypothetical protein [Rhodocyclaceae bacterium]